MYKEIDFSFPFLVVPSFLPALCFLPFLPLPLVLPFATPFASLFFPLPPLALTPKRERRRRPAIAVTPQQEYRTHSAATAS